MIKVNNTNIETWKFYGGECNVRIAIPIYEHTLIKSLIRNADDIMYLLLAVDAVRRVNPRTEVHLVIPYFPYARQDRVCNKGEPFSIVVMTDLINSLRCASVTIFDPHSEVTTNLITNCKVISQLNLIYGSRLESKIKDNNWTLVSPDQGAHQKTSDIAVNFGMNVVFCAKKRNSENGEILEVALPETFVGEGEYIIVDDICDGGRTFIEIAKKLKEAGAGRIFLYVTHGIFSNGFNQLEKYFAQIYCHQCFLSKEFTDQYPLLTVLGGDK